MKVDSRDPDHKMQALSESSATDFTPDHTTVTQSQCGEVWDGRILAVPSPGNTYTIVEHGTDRAICLEATKPFLSNDPNANNRWLVVEHQGYYGLLNKKTGRYISHDGRNRIHAAVKKMSDWECFVPRQHHQGGYQLLSPYYQHTMMIVTVSGDGKGLERRQHADTCWDFIRT